MLAVLLAVARRNKNAQDYLTQESSVAYTTSPSL